MNMTQIEIMIIASLVAVSCSLVGVFLVLRRMAMMSDAITHTVLLGIVLAFFVTHDLSSPWLLLGAALMGILTVYLVELLQRTRLLSEEASIGVVFPFIFSLAIVLISTYAGSVHLDTDAVLLGELAFAPLDRVQLFGMSIPSAYVNSSLILLVDIIVIVVFFKELKITSFDAILAATLGFSPVLMNYLLMTLVSITAVGAFNAVGSILVIAFMIGPPITAFLLTHDLKKMIVFSVIISIINVVLGYMLALALDVSIAGSMAVMTGLTFVVVFLFSKREGYITTKIRNASKRKEFDELVVLFVVKDNENVVKKELLKLINKKPAQSESILLRLVHSNQIAFDNEMYHVTELGSKRIQEQEHFIFDR